MKKTAMNIVSDEPLAPYTTMEVGGRAKHFVRVATSVELVEAVEYALEKGWPYFILGGGSNIIVSDGGYEGLVIKNESQDILIDPVHSIVQADTGVRSGRMAAQAASAGLSGAEFLFGIPGTIGGAVYGNAGLRGHETAEILKDVILLTVKDGRAVVVKRSAAWMEYEHRSSRLKRQREGQAANETIPVIISARFQLYQARSEVILSRTKEFLGHRRGGPMEGGGQHGWQPTGLKCAGSIFRNPSQDPNEAAGRLLELVGAKRLTVGGAAVAKEHANWLYNKRNATAADLVGLIQVCQQRVEEKFNIPLKLEVELIGKHGDTETT